MTIGFKTKRGDALPRSSPSLILPRQDSSSSSSSACVATCPPPNDCPACPTGQICVGIPRSCQACASNVCQPDPEYSSQSSSNHKSSPLGGALGGVLAILAVLVIGYFLWSRRKKKRLELQRKIRNETKVKEAGMAFRPKRKSKLGGENEIDEQAGGVAIEMNDQSRKSSKSLNGSSTNLNGDETEEIIEDEEDIEWTEMRSDGLTVYKKPNGISDKEAEEEYLRNLENKRYSSGAATHLSRITEGVEEEDEVASLRRASSLNPPPLPPLNNLNNLSNSKNHSHSSSINLDPVNGGGNNARSRKSRTDFNGFNVNNPFFDSASENSSNNHSNKGINHMNSPITPPDPVHRPAGAPLVDLQSGKSPSRRGSLAPSTTSTNSSSNNHGNGSSNSGHSSSGHHQGGGMSRNLLSPNPKLNNGGAPMRPNRAPDLNLRLADGAEPGPKSPTKDSRFKIGLGIDSNDNNRASSATFDSYNTDASGGRPMSPAAASSNFHHSSGHSTLKSPLSPNNLISPGAQSQRFDFMSIDPSSSGGNYSSALESSNVYSRNDDKRLSSATVGTLGTMNTTASDYVLSKPQIMTLNSPSTSNGTRSNPNTPGLKSNINSPVVIRPANSNNKPQVLKNLAQAKERGLLRTSPRGTPISEVSNPFSDDNSNVEPDDGLESSASSLAPRIRNPFSDDHSSEFDQDYHSISDQSQSASRALSPSGTFGFGDGRSRSRAAGRGSSGGAQTPNTFGGIDEGEDLEGNDDFISELNGRNKNRNTSKSFSNNRDSTATFQTVASGFSMGIPFIDVNKSKGVPLRNPESSSPRDEKGSYDISEGGERSSWLSQSPSISSNFNRSVINHGKEKERTNGSSSSRLIPNKSNDSERASMISNLSSISTLKEDEDIVINQAEKVDLKRADSAQRYEYEVGRNVNVSLSRSNSSNTNGNSSNQRNSNNPNSRVNSMATTNANPRQSNASSIGGLSAFEFAPFNGEDNETMPKDAVQKAKSHQSTNKTQLLNPDREINTPLESPVGFGEGETDGDFEDEEFLEESSGGRNGSKGGHNGNDSNHSHGRNNSGSLGGSNKIINTGADPETVEQIRLAHELSNYPFQMG